MVDFMDIRNECCTLCDGRVLNINPDIIADFRNMPFSDNSYKLIVFDPPHFIHVGDNSYMAKKYGKLINWKNDLKKGFDECMRVLDDYGVLVFKWSDTQLKVKTVIKAIGHQPLFGHKTSRHTIWMYFMKLPE